MREEPSDVDDPGREGGVLPGGAAADDSGAGEASPLRALGPEPPREALTSQGGPGASAALAAQLTAADQRWMNLWLSGPTRLRWDRLPPQVGDPAPDVELVDQEGAPVTLSGLWSRGAGALHLFFLRHFGCSCMRERWEQLNRDIPSLLEAGARTVAVGMGEPERARLFMQQRGISVPVLCDPEGRAYGAYGVLEGPVPAILHDTPWRPGDEAAGREMMEGRRDTDRRLVDNPWILPAEFVIGSDGLIWHAHRYQYCEDFPPTSVLLGVLHSARQRPR
jgi:peroxiredoxin